MAKVIVECRSRWIAEILKKKIAEAVEDVELSYNLPVGAIKEIEVIG